MWDYNLDLDFAHNLRCLCRFGALCASTDKLAGALAGRTGAWWGVLVRSRNVNTSLQPGQESWIVCDPLHEIAISVQLTLVSERADQVHLDRFTFVGRGLDLGSNGFQQGHERRNGSAGYQENSWAKIDK